MVSLELEVDEWIVVRYKEIRIEIIFAPNSRIWSIAIEKI